MSAALTLVASAPPASAEPAAAIVPGNVLWLFDTSSPGAVTARSITGLGAFESVRGIDVRPATGGIYVFTVTAGSASNSVIRTYALDAATGKATFVGSTAAALAGAADVPTGWDFNPPADLIRYVNTNDEDARIRPVDGALAGNDTDLTPAATTTIIAAAYDRNRLGAGATTLYEIDRNESQVSIQGGLNGTPSPNFGVVTDLAPLGFTLSATGDGGFDVSPSGTAYAALTNNADNLTRLYTIALPTSVTATPAATAVGPVADGQTSVLSLTILDDDRDSDGRLTTADNCASVANPDQGNLDGDGSGDACDDDQDGDAIPDAVEGLLGTNPRASDSDGDGRPDSSDRCPTTAAATGDGCATQAAPPPSLAFQISGVPNRIALRALRRKGISVTVEPNQQASFLFELLGKSTGGRIARVRDIVLAEKRLPRAAGRRSTRVRIPRSTRRMLRRTAKLRLRTTATDALGRTAVRTRRLKIR